MPLALSCPPFAWTLTERSSHLAVTARPPRRRDRARAPSTVAPVEGASSTGIGMAPSSGGTTGWGARWARAWVDLTGKAPGSGSRSATTWARRSWAAKKWEERSAVVNYGIFWSTLQPHYQAQVSLTLVVGGRLGRKDGAMDGCAVGEFDADGDWLVEGT